MSLIVQKFGGSSVRDTEHLLRMAHIARERRAEGNDVVVVLSAQGDTTDTLLKKALELTPSPDGREMDALLASGEQVSAALGALALQTLGVDAVSLSAWQVPIETDGAHGDAQIEMIDTARIRRELDAGRVAVVTGFQGIDERGDITIPTHAYTMGIGGIMKAKRVLLVVNGANKAQAVKDCFFGPIKPQAPGSILQLHPDFTLVADEAALSLVKDLL